MLGWTEVNGNVEGQRCNQTAEHIPLILGATCFWMREVDYLRSNNI